MKTKKFMMIQDYDYNQLILLLDEVKESIRKENLSKIWMNKQETCKLLNVCTKTLDNYLSKGIINHSKFAGKTYIRYIDIDNHLMNNYYKGVIKIKNLNSIK